MSTGPFRIPRSLTQVVPVISPLPFRANQLANTPTWLIRPRGSTAVTPVRTGPSSRRIVVCPTSSPETSVMAFSGPGSPSKGTPRSRARVGVWAGAPAAIEEIITTAQNVRRDFIVSALLRGGGARSGRVRRYRRLSRR